MASKAQILNALERAIGVTEQELSRYIEAEVESSFSFVEDEFNRVLDELRGNSISGTFESYEVEVERDTTTVNLPRSGRSIRLPTATFYVKSPNPNLNVFDIIDQGRPELPRKNQGAYPMWSLRNPTLTATERRRDPVTGRFAFSLPAERSAGIRPANQRNKLTGSYPPNADQQPATWSKGPIAAVPARNLYDRILTNALKKLSRRRLRTIGLVKVPRG